MTTAKKDYAILLALCALLFFLGSSLIPVTDPTESNYAETAKEMLAQGEYLSPLIYGHSWYDKPIMFYWELVASFGIFGVNEFAARFFPGVFASLGVLITYFLGTKLYDRKRGLVSALLLMTTVEYWYVAHAIITDMTLFCAIAGTLTAFYLGYSRGKPHYYYLAYAAAGVGMLTKGPIGLVLPGLIILLFLAWERNLKHLLKMKILPGLVIFAAVSSIWYLPMFLLHGWDFIDTFFGVHNVLRATVSEHPAQNVWYYYLMIFVAGFIPWVFPWLYGLARKIGQDIRERNLPTVATREKFLLTWALTVPLLFQCFATKYVTYTLPYMMPVAILFAGYYASREKLFQRMLVGTAAVFMALLFAVAAPLCQDFSGKNEAAELQPLLSENMNVVSYRGGYSASLVFYSGQTIYRLESKSGLDNLKPQKMDWSSTNVMPFMAIEEIPEGKPTLAIVDPDREANFLALAQGQWELVKEGRRVKYYYRR
ncbi:MAG: glycosyltransferase family 39 protein [Selenomonadaceae bacterium]|nr:glycosyltransferase family 39 protein [Selenomonadaceae bacterium]